MNSKLSFFFFTFLFLLIFSCTQKTQAPPISPEVILQNEIHYLIEDPEVANAQIGVYIESLKEGKVLFRQNEHKLFVPGSNQKLYTTATALEKLGQNFRFETDFYTKGQISDSVLSGDLLIFGKGDPTISGRFRNDDNLAYFNDWVDSLKAKGIKKINGNIIVYNGYFSDRKLGIAWEWGDLPFSFAAQIDALSYNENYVKVLISADSTISDTVFVKLEPATDYVQVINNAHTIHKDSVSTLDVWRYPGSQIIEITGGLPQNNHIKNSITVENPALWFVEIFESVLKSKNIPFSGGTVIDSSPLSKINKDNIKLLFSHYSPALTEIVKATNKESNNFYAEQIFKTLGAEIKKEGTVANAALAEAEWLNSIGITDNQISIMDGSGLSRRNLISPIATATLLRHMYYSKNFKPFYDSLPIAGIDGTLKNRMVNTNAQNIARAKTGYVSNVWCLSGYTSDRMGNDYLFVIMINHFSTTSPFIKNLEDKICILLTNYLPSN